MRFKYFLVPLCLIFYFIFYQSSILNNSSDIFYDLNDKLWAHRILDPNKLNFLSDEFIGYEIDVYFDNEKKKFIISHHGESNNYSLSTYLNEIKDLNNIKLWIDFKNLDASNVESSVIVLDEIAKEYAIKSNIIIESKNINLLSLYKINGFYISYWLPSFHFIKSVFNIINIRDDLIEYTPNAISMPFSSVSFYSKKFPNYPIHCWTNGMNKENDKDEIRSLNKQKNIKIILTDFKRNFLK
tara:strand:+ start:40 stop:762 length:723 start_codon:yes stop_codon:yes gene_type:complete